MLERITSAVKNFFTPNRLGLTVCLAVALAGWFLTKMSKVYTHQLTFSLKYIVPTNMTFDVAPPQLIDVDLRASGWSLLSLIRENDSIEVSASEIAGKPTSLKILLSDKLSQLVGDDINLINVAPEILQFDLVERESKKVAIRLQGDLELNPQFQWREPLKIEPDSITIFGSSERLSSIDSWPTEKISLKNISQNLREQVLLERSTLALAADTGQVTVTGFVDQITEKEIYVPIQVEDTLRGEVSIFPDQALVRVNLGLSQYDELRASDFLLVAQMTPGNPTGLEVVVKKHPPNVNYVSHTPTTVDFIRSNP